MNFLSGKKLLIVTVLAALSSIVKLFTGHDPSDLACALADKAVDGGCAAMAGPLVTTLAQIIVVGFTSWAATKGIAAMKTQIKAGATLHEAGTVVGEVKEAIAKGVIPPVIIQNPADAIPPAPVKLEEIKARNADVLKSEV